MLDVNLLDLSHAFLDLPVKSLKLFEVILFSLILVCLVRVNELLSLSIINFF